MGTKFMKVYLNDVAERNYDLFQDIVKDYALEFGEGALRKFLTSASQMHDPNGLSWVMLMEAEDSGERPGSEVYLNSLMDFELMRCSSDIPYIPVHEMCGKEEWLDRYTNRRCILVKSANANTRAEVLVGRFYGISQWIDTRQGNMARNLGIRWTERTF